MEIMCSMYILRFYFVKQKYVNLLLKDMTAIFFIQCIQVYLKMEWKTKELIYQKNNENIFLITFSKKSTWNSLFFQISIKTFEDTSNDVNQLFKPLWLLLMKLRLVSLMLQKSVNWNNENGYFITFIAALLVR